jgi:undecaprenyl-diphosphatase
MTPAPENRPGPWHEIEALDVAVYAAISATATPTLDRYLAAVSRAADHGKLWSAVAAVLALAGARRGRRAAVDGLASLALTSTVVNLGLKPLGRRRRPDRAAYHVPVSRQVAMPRTTSFPSGHAASASAFATASRTSSRPWGSRFRRRPPWSGTRVCTPVCTTPWT